jgi:hypothetical protein
VEIIVLIAAAVVLLVPLIALWIDDEYDKTHAHTD